MRPDPTPGQMRVHVVATGPRLRMRFPGGALSPPPSPPPLRWEQSHVCVPASPSRLPFSDHLFSPKPGWGLGEQGSRQRRVTSIFNFYGNHVLEIPKGLEIVLCFQNLVMLLERLCCK